MRSHLARMTLGFAAIVFLTPSLALAQVPTKEDTISCNEKAKSELATAAASPRLDGSAPARPAPSPEVKKPTAEVKKESAREPGTKDPQLQGIDPDGARDPAYVAAYKTCMRQAGF